MTYLTYVIVTDLLPDVDSPTVCLFVLVCHVLSCDMHVTSYCHSSTVHLFGIDTSHWYYPPLQRPTEGETAPSCTAALLEAVLQCVSLEEVALENCSFGMQVCVALAFDGVGLLVHLSVTTTYCCPLSHGSCTDGDDAVETFAKHLKDSRVTKLEMTRCHELSPNQIATLCRGLHWSRSLEELCIEYYTSQGKVRLIGVLVLATFSVLPLHIQFV